MPKGKKSNKGKKKAASVKVTFKRAKPKLHPKRAKTFKGGKKAASFAVAAARNMRPKVKTLRMGQKAGLTLNGGTISGVVEVTPSLQILSAAKNVAGNILALIPIHAQTIAPGTRLSDIAAMYDQYVFDQIWFELDCASNYIESGTLLGFVEANATDVIGAVNSQVGNITEWVDHGSAQIHPIAKGVLTFPKRGSYMKRISKGPKGGFYINTVIPTSSASSLSVSDCFQGQFCLMIHNPINTQGGQALSYPVDLGALRVHFKLKLREAAERTQENGAADTHISTFVSSSNPLNWSTVVTEQSTMQVGSNLGFQGRFTGGNTYQLQLPPGKYAVTFAMLWSATGVSDWWFAFSGNQTGCTSMDSWFVNPKLSQGTTQTGMAFVTLNVTTAGVYNIFTSNGSSTGWTCGGDTRLTITSLPSSMLSLLKHKDLELRSLAWIDHQNKQDQTSEVLRAVRAELGLEKKLSSSEEQMQRKYRAILRERAAAKEKNEKRFLVEEKGQKAEDDDWDEPDDKELPVTDPRHRWYVPGYIYAQEEDTRSQRSDRDEVKARAPGSSRPSSLKSSSGGKDKS